MALTNEAKVLERAIGLAVGCHSGQTDRAGRPYILHCLRVMHQQSTDTRRIIAVLHDFLEDGPQQPTSWLTEIGCSEHVINCLVALSREKDETRMQAARRTALYADAVAVKLADLRDNMDLTRLKKITTFDLERQKEYCEVYHFLVNCNPPN